MLKQKIAGYQTKVQTVQIILYIINKGNTQRQK